jgi:hypothetical protein
MKTLKKSVSVLLLTVFAVFMVGWVFWALKPGKDLHVLIINKTVNDYGRTGHKSLTWVLNHNRFLNTNGKKYSLARDYYGFVPLRPKNSGNYETRRIRLDDIEKTVAANDVLYIADMYGIYFDEWFKSRMKKGSSSKIIGGINQNDFLLLKAMKDEGKSIIIESNFFTEPTEPLVRNRTEELLNLSYSGWSGKYFSRLDTARNKDLPHWIVNLYKAGNQGSWPFKGEGIVFIKGRSAIVVLEAQKHLNNPVPSIMSDEPLKSGFQLPEKVPYYSWFEVIVPGKDQHIASHYSIDANAEGKLLLQNNGIPDILPAVLLDQTGKLYYFAGDFANEDIAYYTYNFPFIPYIKQNLGLYSERNKFLWEYYIPLMNGIFNEIYKSNKEGK